MTKITIDPCVVHTPTKEEWDKLLQLLEDNTDLELLDEIRWELWKQDSCIDIQHGGIDFCTSDYYELQGNTILTFEEFMEKYDKVKCPTWDSPMIIRTTDNRPENPKKNTRTWEVETTAKSSDGIVVGKNEIKVEIDFLDYFMKDDVLGCTEKQARDLMNKLRKGLEKHKQLFKND